MPTTSFTTNSDYALSCTGATYPPAGVVTAPDTETTLRPGRSFSAGTYFIVLALLRFDTSAIPNDATVTAAVLRVYLDLIDNADTRNLTADWYTPIGHSPTDYSETAQTGALSTPIAGMTLNADNDFSLSSVSNVSKTGTTWLRLHVDGGVPTGINRPRIQAIEHATLAEARLIVTYTGAATDLVGMVGI